MKTVILHGILGEKFGKEYELEIDTIREATVALASQMKDFKKFMLNADAEGLKFAVFTDSVAQGTNVAEDNLDSYTGASVIHIVPKVVGAGGDSGILQLIAGAALIAVGVFTGQPYLVAMGASLAIGGLTTMLMPTPDIEGQDPDGNKPSNGFGGAVTTVAQGNPVPVLYGEREIGGFICSAGIYTEDQA